MTIYFQTARILSGNPAGKAVLRKEPVSFSIRGWEDFSRDLELARPSLAKLLARTRIPVDDLPRHPTYLMDGKPLVLAWTDVECRRLFESLAGANQDPGMDKHDFWEFTAMVCMGIAEDGICGY